MAEAEARKNRLSVERDDLLARPAEVPELPPIEELKARAREAVGKMAFDDPVFGRQMRALVPRVEVFPYRLIDGGAVVLRALLTIDLAPLLGPGRTSIGEILTHTAVIDLFDPPQRASFRERVIELRVAGLTEREVAVELGIMQPAVQHAAALNRAMQKAGITDPYQPLTTPPNGDGKLRRHIHPRYEFRPLPGYPASLDPA